MLNRRQFLYATGAGLAGLVLGPISCFNINKNIQPQENPTGHIFEVRFRWGDFELPPQESRYRVLLNGQIILDNKLFDEGEIAFMEKRIPGSNLYKLDSVVKSINLKEFYDELATRLPNLSYLMRSGDGWEDKLLIKDVYQNREQTGVDFICGSKSNTDRYQVTYNREGGVHKRSILTN